ncbi:hypothetical protein [Cohnella soli]
MQPFLELKGHMIALNAVRAIVKDEERVVLLLINQPAREVSLDDDRLMQQLVLLAGNHGFTKYVEVVGGSLKTPLIEDNGRPYSALINLNLIAEVKEGWEGQIHFTDGSMIESANSYAGMLSVLKLPMMARVDPQ